MPPDLHSTCLIDFGQQNIVQRDYRTECVTALLIVNQLSFDL